MEKLPTRWNLDDRDSFDASYYESCESSETHWHTHYLLTLYTDGSGSLSINGVDVEVSQGDMVILSNTDFHSHRVKPEEKLSFYSIKFHYDRCSSQVRDYIPIERFPVYAHLSGEQFDLAKALAQYVYRVHQKKQEHPEASLGGRLAIEQLLVMGYESRVAAGVANLLSELSETVGIGELHSRSKQVYQAVCYIQAHFREPGLRVSDIAASVGYTERYFSETFKKVLGCPCRLSIQKCRLEFARRLILSGGVSVTQVCYEAGFTDLSYFISSFRRMYGTPPGKYAEQYQE